MIRTSDVRASNQGRDRSREPELQTEIKQDEYKIECRRDSFGQKPL